MYAVIKTGGKQYRVVEGQRLRVEKLPGNEGDTVTFGDVLMLGGDTPKIGQPLVWQERALPRPGTRLSSGLDNKPNTGIAVPHATAVPTSTGTTAAGSVRGRAPSTQRFWLIGILSAMLGIALALI